MEIQIQKTESEKWFEEYLDRTQPPKVDDRLTISLDNIRSTNPKVAQSIIQHPSAFHKIALNWASPEEADGKYKYVVGKTKPVSVSFQGNLGSNFVTPRGLCSRMANQLVGIQGIVTRTSISRFQLQKSVHWCEKTGSLITKSYPDHSAPEQDYDIKKNRTIPTTDINGNPLKFEFGRSTFKDHETGVVQELPENAPAGLLPRSVNFLLPSQFCDKVKPGDRVQMIGIYKIIPNFQSKENGILKPVFIVTSISPLVSTPSPTLNNKLSIKVPYPEDQLLELFSQSISPSIHGHPQLKKAVLLMLLGGVEKTLDNNGHLRGDINILMVGDPGTAKSQMLRWVLASVDVGINTTGSGASGVGLTAAITYDKDSGEKSIEAGAMVLADRGFVCIDEFDKMEEADRVAVHEVMEQQTVTIAKAGIHCSLNARCSVIAAANPIYGEYQKDKTPSSNIGMPDSLLSRFDLIFVIIDEKEADIDKKIAERVCKNHRYANVELLNDNNVEDNYIIQPVENGYKNEDMMFEKSALFKTENKIEILTQGYLRKYISHCRKNIQPVLTDESVEVLSILWSSLREKEINGKNMETKVLPVTIRSYETLIRLSTAHAKLRLSSEIEIVDCVEAFRLVVFTLYKNENEMNKELRDAIEKVMGKDKDFEKREKTNKKSKPVEDEEENTEQKKNKKRQPKTAEQIKRISAQIERININEEDENIDSALYGPNNKSKIHKEVFVAFTKLTSSKKKEECTVDELVEKLPHLARNVVVQALKEMDKKDKIFFNNEKNKIHLV